MKKEDWFKPRGYLHFDARIRDNDFENIKKYVSNAKIIKQHNYFPFLTYNKDKPKIIVDNTTHVRRFIMKERPISYASHLDSQIYSFYSSKLNELYEKKLLELNLHENVIAFRKIKSADGDSKCNIHLAKDAFDKIKEIKNCKVFAFDITKFFDSLDANILKNQWANLLGFESLPEDHYSVFKSITSHAKVDRDKLFERLRISRDFKKQKALSKICSVEKFRTIVREEKYIYKSELGIPQGSPISATLANIYMLEFDSLLANRVISQNGFYYRYCDDIFIILPLNSDLEISLLIKELLSKYLLKINDDKTDESIFYESNGSLISNKPINYLGFVYDGKSISLRPAGLSHYRSELKKAINRSIAAKLSKKSNKPVFLKKIRIDFSHFGKRNYITYGKRAYKITNSEAIRKQLAGLHRFLEKETKRAKAVK